MLLFIVKGPFNFNVKLYLKFQFADISNPWKTPSSYNMLVFNSLWFALFCYKDLFCIWRDSLFCCPHGCVQAISARLILSQRLRKRENIMGFLNSMWLIVSFAYENQNDNYTFFYSSTCQNYHINNLYLFCLCFFSDFYCNGMSLWNHTGDSCAVKFRICFF